MGRSRLLQNASNWLDEIDAITIREHGTQDHEIGLKLGSALNGCLSVAYAIDDESIFGESLFHIGEVRWIPSDNKDAPASDWTALKRGLLGIRLSRRLLR